jgi:hypothetical protein
MLFMYGIRIELRQTNIYDIIFVQSIILKR